ncbi:7-cyano-7-deazaguanine reductase [Allopseudospirillum japonicum]|uniref:NADPH-dependent 7-cyano-7-deazaguanine reductase n=1 Tax=Allopseudospirillum japonicum TaxID=64971 RepID=A0A1H6SVW5_9GAMM|nr:NADPH-dependent 7-cyano-7-deazaguanine reductase QueF [Allopseudospirillum japonicum]SEI72098.1 7-cyano-7-deazaguanine reductase [Allopseudospirillum japonicum]
MHPAEASNLGKASPYPKKYDSKWLYPIARHLQRQHLQTEGVPCYGEDMWTAYEVSWLDMKAKPQIALASIRLPLQSQNLIESKSLKLYLNSFNQSQWPSLEAVQAQISQDLTQVAGMQVQVDLWTWQQAEMYLQPKPIQGMCLDDLELQDEIASAPVDQPDLLADVEKGKKLVKPEYYYSHLLKSNCPVTGQPDWATLWIEYQGAPLNLSALLAYILSFRQHQDFHEHCVERIYYTLWHVCQPEKLSVYARYTRRGGLDINPWRTSDAKAAHAPLIRTIRQ